jgi:hypothetical protein
MLGSSSAGFMIAVWERAAPLSGAEGSETAIMGPGGWAVGPGFHFSASLQRPAPAPTQGDQGFRALQGGAEVKILLAISSLPQHVRGA